MTTSLERKAKVRDGFADSLSVPLEDIEFELSAFREAPWTDYYLNPRRLRGSDFLMRWSQGVRSEERVVQAVNDSHRYFALPYGPSSTAPENDIREYEQYFDRLEKAGLGDVKRPDLLIFEARRKESVSSLVEGMGGAEELPFTPESAPAMRTLLSEAILAVECENSLWRAKQMPDFGSALTPQKRLGGLAGLKKTAVVPTVILKEEDRKPLRQWQQEQNIPIHIWQVFYDVAFGIGVDRVEELIINAMIEPTEQVFQAPGGATTRKVIYKVYYHHAYPVGLSSEEPSLIANSITDKNGHILPYVRFEGGKLQMSCEALAMLDEALQQREKAQR